jgi:hypothetical protein
MQTTPAEESVERALRVRVRGEPAAALLRVTSTLHARRVDVVSLSATTTVTGIEVRAVVASSGRRFDQLAAVLERLPYSESVQILALPEPAPVGSVIPRTRYATWVQPVEVVA